MRRFTVFLVVFISLSFKSGYGIQFDEQEFKDFLQLGGNVNFTQVSRSAKTLGISLEDHIENFIKSNELSMRMPFGSRMVVSGRNLDLGEINMKLNLDNGSESEARKKHKIKKVLAPIVVVLLLKAITLIPLALGVLGIKTWNALQLSFISFVTSIGIAVWKLSSKFSEHHIAAPQIIHEAVHDVHVPQHVYHDHDTLHHDDHHIVHHDHHHLDDHHHHLDDHPHHHHHDLWDHPYHRSDDEETPQNLAYNGYAPENIKS